MPQPLVFVLCFVAALAVCVGWLATASIKNVPRWARLVVFRRGQTSPKLVFGPGRRFVVPFVDQPVLVDMREQTVRLPRQTVVTRNGSAVGVELQVRYQIVDPLVSETKVADFRGAVAVWAANQLRASIGQTHSADVQARRTRIAEELQVKLAEVVAGWGGRVVRVEIGEIGSPGRSSLVDPAVAR